MKWQRSTVTLLCTGLFWACGAETAEPESDSDAAPIEDGGADATPGEDNGVDAALPEGDAAPGAHPCARISSAILGLPPTRLGQTATYTVTLESCGAVPVEITALRLSDDSSEAFSLVAAEVESLPFRLPAARPGEAPPRHDVSVSFQPAAEMAYEAQLIVETDDPLRPILETSFMGRGTLNECPVAQVVTDRMEVVPLDTVVLDGGASTDANGPGGAPVGYSWTVTERPDGSTAQPVESFFDPQNPTDGGPSDNGSTPAALFFVDLAGQYTIELTVRDELDQVAPSDLCPQPAASIRIDARPDSDIHVQMVWTTPGDPDETDADGTDLDLHLLHPRAREWKVAPLDCYSENANPDWGPPGPSGDPSLAVDDMNGAGPEAVSLNDPEATDELGAPYRVGVEYYRTISHSNGRDWGPSEATIRVFLGGVPSGEWVRRLDRAGNFWEVASITWTEGDKSAEELDRFYEDGP